MYQCKTTVGDEIAFAAWVELVKAKIKGIRK